MKHLQKCGEILVDVKSKDKINKTYILHCSFCNVEFHQVGKFYLHIENHLNYSEGILKDTEIKVKLEPEETDVEVKLESEQTEVELEPEDIEVKFEQEDLQTEGVYTAIERPDVKLEPDPDELIYESFASIAGPDVEQHCEPFIKIKIPKIKVEEPLKETQTDEFAAVNRTNLKVFANSAEENKNFYKHFLNTVNDSKVKIESVNKHEAQSIICNSDSDEQIMNVEYFSRKSPGISSMFGSERGHDVEDYIHPLHIPKPYISNDISAKRKTERRNNETLMITSAERQRQYRQRLKLDKARYEAYRIRERERKRIYRKQFKQRRLK